MFAGTLAFYVMNGTGTVDHKILMFGNCRSHDFNGTDIVEYSRLVLELFASAIAIYRRFNLLMQVCQPH